MDDSVFRERIRVELREVASLMEAAEQIADGLVAMCEHAYNHDGRTKEALVVANHAAVQIGLVRADAQARIRGLLEARNG